jgi:hypothetical protein
VFWFAFAVTFLDQLRRQFAALGVVTGPKTPASRWARLLPEETRLLLTVAVVLLGSVVAVWTASLALQTVDTMVHVVVTLDVGLVTLDAVVTMLVFFVAFGVAATALDRLVIDGLRTMLGE